MSNLRLLNLYNQTGSTYMMSVHSELSAEQAIQAVEHFLESNNMLNTLKDFRCELLGKVPRAPSSQFFDAMQQRPKSDRNQVLTTSKTNKAQRNDCLQEGQLTVEGLLGKIAYSDKLLYDHKLNGKVSSMMKRPVFWKALNHMFPQTQQNKPQRLKLKYLEQAEIRPFDSSGDNSSSQFTDAEKKNPADLSSNNLNHRNEQSECDSPMKDTEKAESDSDLGYSQLIYSESQAISSYQALCERFKSAATKPNTSKQPLYNLFLKKRLQKLDSSVEFHRIDAEGSPYPLKHDGATFDMHKISVIFDRQRTGLQQTTKLSFRQGDMIAARYQVDQILGRGAFSQVYKVTDQITNKSTCLKIINNEEGREKDYLDQGLDQIRILKYVAANVNTQQHHLLTFYDAFYYKQHLCIETELLHSNLYSLYSQMPGFFSLGHIRDIAEQVLRALVILSKLHIIHSDLKPENILIKSYDPLQVKVVDFGNSIFSHDELGTYVQSRSYRAPEVILGLAYSDSIDIWSLGCILAELWTKKVLFENQHVQGLLTKIQGLVGPWPEWMLSKGREVQLYFNGANLIYFHQGQLFHIMIPKDTTLAAQLRTDNSDFVDFLTRTLSIDPFERISAEQALQHPFITKGSQLINHNTYSF